jgi:hypothetical protein
MKFKTRIIKGKDETNNYPDNLYVSIEHSFFNELMQLICLKFPVPEKKYKVKNIYNFSKGKNNRIVIHITNEKSNPTRGMNKDWVLSGIFHTSDMININTNQLVLNENSQLTILVYNDDRAINSSNISNHISESDFEKIESRPRTKYFLERKMILLPEPDEKEGGGVIVEGP